MLNLRQFGRMLQSKPGPSDFDDDEQLWDRPHEVHTMSGVQRRVRTVPGAEPSPQLPGFESH